MPKFQIINSNHEITLNPNWIDSSKFESKGRIVDTEGKFVSSDYKGRYYQIISKKERYFPILERIGRVALGILFVTCSLGLALFHKPVKNLFTKSKENIRFGVELPFSNIEQLITSYSDIEYRNTNELKDAQLILMGENHGIKLHRQLEANILNQYGSDESIFLLEGLESKRDATSAKEQIYSQLVYKVPIQPKFRIYGWDNMGMHKKQGQIKSRLQEIMNDLAKQPLFSAGDAWATVIPKTKEFASFINQQEEETESYTKLRDESCVNTIKKMLQEHPQTKIIVFLGRDHVRRKGYNILDHLPADLKSAAIKFKDV